MLLRFQHIQIVADLPGSVAKVLFACAAAADQNGKCFVSQARFAKELGMDARHLRRRIQFLQKRGLVRCTGELVGNVPVLVILPDFTEPSINETPRAESAPRATNARGNNGPTPRAESAPLKKEEEEAEEETEGFSFSELPRATIDEALLILRNIHPDQPISVLKNVVHDFWKKVDGTAKGWGFYKSKQHILGDVKRHYHISVSKFLQTKNSNHADITNPDRYHCSIR